MKFYRGLKDAIKLYGQLNVYKDKYPVAKAGVIEFDNSVLIGKLDYKKWYSEYTILLYKLQNEKHCKKVQQA